MISLALSLLFTFLPADSGTRIIDLPVFHGEVRIPVQWSVEVEEYPDIVVIRDVRKRGCRLSLTRHEGGDPPAVIRRVHEHIYLGPSSLPRTRGEAHVRKRISRRDATFGEYPRKGRGGRIFCMFWSTETDGYAAVLTCPRGAPGDWGVAAALFGSIR